MMMPANFSVIAENELTYVVGGSAITDAVKTFNTNMITIVGNSYVADLVSTTLGTMFSGSWGENNNLLDNLSNKFFPDSMNGFNHVLQAVGLGAAVYQLGTASTGVEIASPGKSKIYLGKDDEGNDVYTKKYKNVFTKWGKLPSPLAWL